MIPQDYLKFVSGSVGAEVSSDIPSPGKPYKKVANLFMSCRWWISLCFAIVEALQDVVKAFSIINSPFWEHVKEILNPESSVGAEPWVYYSIYAFFVFLFNIFDIVSKKEISDYLNKMGAWIPNFKPGKATIEYLTKIQASTRFWGGLLLTILATTSSILDHWLRHINEGYAIGFLQF
ncbi:hypothetical protein MLD38_026422 [Melastoma candidum]|nr:hypothetical protein MLD38_026422 [Melastoma candidum]